MGLLDHILGNVSSSGISGQSASPFVQIAMKRLTEQGAGGQSGLAEVLPDLINHVTLEGKLPESSDFINNARARLLKR
ncbi:MAG: hypothetical protein ACKO15_16590 [Burkholderiales bacterium]